MTNKPDDTLQNAGRLCSIYCPGCKRVTTKISFNILREAGTVEVYCPECGNNTHLEYDGKIAKIWNYG
jgi:ribosomal protein S27E